MKQKLKHLLKFIMLCAVIAISSCTQEKEYVNAKNHKNVYFKEKTLDELLKQSFFAEPFSKFAKSSKRISSSAESRTALEENFDFTIVPGMIKVAEKEDGSVTYTFLIERIIKDETFFENLIIDVNVASEYDAFMIKYIPENAQNFFANYAANGSFSGTKETTFLETSKVDNNSFCTYIYESICFRLGTCDGVSYQEVHSPINEQCCPTPFCIPMYVCLSGGAGADEGSNPPDNSQTTSSTTSNGGGGAADSDPITTPIPCVNCIEDPITTTDPCIELTKKSNDSVFKAKFDALKTNTNFANNFEVGWFEGRNTLGNTTYAYAQGTPSSPFLQVPLNFIPVSFVHVHTDYLLNDGIEVSTVKNFSVQDIIELIRIQTYATNLSVPASEIYGMMISSEGIFALKLHSPPVANLTNNDWFKFNYDYKTKMNDLFINEQLNSYNVKNVLIDLLKKYGLYDKIGLYEAEFPENSTIPKWKRVKKGSNGLITYEPC